MNQKGIDVFNDGVQAMLLAQPFFGTLLMKLQHTPQEEIVTAAVDGVHLFYNPEFFANFDTDEAVFVVGHEVLHCAWMHLDRIKHYLDCGIGPDGHPLDMRLFNMALDYPINASLVASNIGKPPKDFPLCLDRSQFPETMTPEEVYCLLKQQGKGGKGGKGQPQQGQGGQPVPGQGSGGPQPLDGHLPRPGGTTDGITSVDVQQAANNCKAVRGTLPAGIDRLLGEIRKPDQSSWRRLRQLVTSSLRGYDASTWRRLQRRMIVRGVGMPGRTAHGAGTVGVVVDTSGSIGQDMLNLFGGHMAAIIEDARPERVLVYWTDAKMHRRDTVKTGSELRAMMAKPVPGGGGTDMPEGVEAAEADKCDSIVVLTDGYTPFCNSSVPVFWAITSHGVRSPHGQTIHIS